MNLFASISAGMCALWGPLHGGASEACVNMLEQIVADGCDVTKFVNMAKDKQSGFRLMALAIAFTRITIRALGSSSLVVGIGVNINNSFSEAPKQIRATGTSLYDASGTYHVPGDVLRTILKRLVLRYEELAADELRLAEEWREHCMLRNRTVHVASGKRTISGLCHGIDDQGALLIEVGSTLLRLKSGTVQRVEGSGVDVV